MITATVLAAADGVLRREAGLPHAASVRAAWTFAALGVLAKGLIGIVIPALVLGVTLATTRRWSSIRALLAPSGIAVFLLVSAPWFIAMERLHPGFLDYFFVEQQFHRYAGGGFNNVQPFWFYGALLGLACLPWWPSVWRAVRAGTGPGTTLVDPDVDAHVGDGDGGVLLGPGVQAGRLRPSGAASPRLSRGEPASTTDRRQRIPSNGLVGGSRADASGRSRCGHRLRHPSRPLRSPNRPKRCASNATRASRYGCSIGMSMTSRSTLGSRRRFAWSSTGPIPVSADATTGGRRWPMRGDSHPLPHARRWHFEPRLPGGPLRAARQLGDRFLGCRRLATRCWHRRTSDSR